MNSNTTADRASGSRQTPGEQHTTSTDTDRTVFTDRDGRELTLVRVADGTTLPFLGYTERAISWGTIPNEATTAGHVSIDVGAGVPDARYYPSSAETGAPHSVSLSARVLDPEAAGYPEAPFVVRLVCDEFVPATHESLLPPAFDLVYWSLADDVSTENQQVATDGGAVPEAEQATDAEVREAVEAAENEGAWKPEPVSLREGETRDDMGHAERNLAQIKRALDDGILDSTDLSPKRRDQLGVDDAAEDDVDEPVLIADGSGHVCETCGETFEREETLDAHQYYQQHDAEIVTDGGREQCIECGSFLVDELEDGTGLCCPQCGTGQHVTDGGIPGVLGRLLGDRAPEARAYLPGRDGQATTDGGLTLASSFTTPTEAQPTPLGRYDEVYDRDHEQFGEVREVVEGAVVGGGRTVDRLRIRWDDGSDEWFHRRWIRADAGRQIERVERDGGSGVTEVEIDVNT